MFVINRSKPPARMNRILLVSLLLSIFSGILVPVLNAVAQVIGTVILPAIGQLVTFLMTNLPPAIGSPRE